jgi:hypothetical protein
MKLSMIIVHITSLLAVKRSLMPTRFIVETPDGGIYSIAEAVNDDGIPLLRVGTKRTHFDTTALMSLLLEFVNAGDGSKELRVMTDDGAMWAVHHIEQFGRTISLQVVP